MRLPAVLLVVFAALALAGPAAADSFTVNTTGDGPDADVAAPACDSDLGAGGSQCTLRAAIEQSNASATTDDEIVFALPDGTVVDVPTDLPALTDTVTIDGRPNCGSTAIDVCFGVRRTTFGAGDVLFDVDAPDVVFRALSLLNAGRAISFRTLADRGEVTDSWFGIRPDGTTLEPNSTGIFTVADAGVFGDATGGGNAFAGGQRGIDLLSSDANTIAGNRFGFLPDGTASAATRVATGVEIASQNLGGGSTDLAINNAIGGAPATATSACDEACNLFGATTGADAPSIRLAPDAPQPSDERQPAATTAIFDNFVGVPATGTACPALVNPGAGIFVGAADEITIGGPGTGNVLGCREGAHILSGDGAQDLTIEDNLVGVMPDGVTPAPSTNAPSMRIGGSGLLVTSNRVGGSGAGGPGESGAGIALSGSGTISDNEIGGTAQGADLGLGGDGIYVRANVSGAADDSVIRGNVIAQSPDDGIVIEIADGVVIRGNTITGNGGDGVELNSVVQPPDGTVIGDADPEAAPDEANTISGNGDDAIHIEDDGSDNTVIGVNRGSGNGTGPGDLFIDLVGTDGPGNTATGPNQGVAAPALTTTATAATGTAEPLAVVYVYRRTADQQNRLDAFLGRTTAGADGSFSFTYPAALPAGAIVAATQQAPAKGTSELASAAVPVPADTGGDGGGGGGDPTPPPAGPEQPPVVPPGPAPPPPTPVLGPTPAQEAALARENLTRILRGLRRARLRGLARRGGVRIRGIRALRAGVLTFRATAGPRRVTILTGRLRFTAAGTARLTVAVARPGRRLVRRPRRLRASARVAFHPAAGAPSSARRSVTLPR